MSGYDSEQIVIVLEGNDDQPFYFDFIKDYFPDKSIFYFSCSGKPTLLSLKAFLEKYELGVKPERLLFFADRDFDDYLHLENPGIFKTEFYSIESYFCTPNYFEYIVKKYAGGQISNKVAAELVTAFAEQLELATRMLIVPMATLCAIRQTSKSADFDSVSCADFIGISAKGLNLHRQRRSAALRELVGDSADLPSCRSVRSFAKKFEKDNFNKWLRGKHGLQLIRTILRALGASRPETNPTLQRLSGFFGGEALKHAKAYLGDLEDLRQYCAA